MYLNKELKSTILTSIEYLHLDFVFNTDWQNIHFLFYLYIHKLEGINNLVKVWTKYFPENSHFFRFKCQNKHSRYFSSNSLTATSTLASNSLTVYLEAGVVWCAGRGTTGGGHITAQVHEHRGPGSSPSNRLPEPRLDYGGLKNLSGITDKISLLDHDNPWKFLFAELTHFKTQSCPYRFSLWGREPVKEKYQ